MIVPVAGIRRTGREFTGGRKSAFYLLLSAGPVLRAQVKSYSFANEFSDGFPSVGGAPPQGLKLFLFELDLRSHHTIMLSLMAL